MFWSKAECLDIEHKEAEIELLKQRIKIISDARHYLFISDWKRLEGAMNLLSDLK